MLVQQRISNKFNEYSILARRMQYFNFATRATSPESASKNLWERVRYNHDPVPPGNARLIMSVWDDPKERGNEWLITGSTLVSDMADTTRHFWNRNHIAPMSLTEEMLSCLRKSGFLA